MFDSFLGSVFLAAPPVVEEGVPRLREEHTQADIVQECVLPRNLCTKAMLSKAFSVLPRLTRTGLQRKGSRRVSIAPRSKLQSAGQTFYKPEKEKVAEQHAEWS